MEKYFLYENESYAVNRIKMINILDTEEKKYMRLFNKMSNYKFLKHNRKILSNMIMRSLYHEIITEEILKEGFFRTFFQAYLMLHDGLGMKQAFSHLECFDYCLETLQDPSKIFCPIFLEKFIEASPNHTWQERIKKCFNDQKLKDPYTILQLKYECLWTVINSQEAKKLLVALSDFIPPVDENFSILAVEQYQENKRTVDKLLILIKNETKKINKAKILTQSSSRIFNFIQDAHK